jgi:putative transposase
MNEKIYPSDLTDEEWEWIKDLIPAAKRGGRPRTGKWIGRMVRL